MLKQRDKGKQLDVVILDLYWLTTLVRGKKTPYKVSLIGQYWGLFYFFIILTTCPPMYTLTHAVHSLQTTVCCIESLILSRTKCSCRETWEIWSAGHLPGVWSLTLPSVMSCPSAKAILNSPISTGFVELYWSQLTTKSTWVWPYRATSTGEPRSTSLSLRLTRSSGLSGGIWREALWSSSD